MKTLVIPSKIHDYNVNIDDSMTSLKSVCSASTKAVFFIDKNVFSIYRDIFSSIPNDRLYILNPVEDKKNIDTVCDIYRFLLGFNDKRNLHIVSIGGGIIQDLTGFTASTLYRGIRWTFFPTTLLAQADSCVGSKTSLNFQQYKNTLGTFYPPHEVHICTPFLKSLSAMEIESGIGEIIKFLLLDDKNPVSLANISDLVEKIKKNGSFEAALLETHRVKRSYISQDEFDFGKRNLFNYGHCFGHALESSSDYHIPHGIAVSIGMVFANVLSVSRGYISEDLFDEINELLLLPNINIRLCFEYFDSAVLLQAMRKDKKRIGAYLSIIVLHSDNFTAVKVDDLSDAEFIDVLDKTVNILGVK
ncbi:AroB-related putative sugar phosphate phospholyase (cyclizing) [Aeromonas hydrophila]|uniref:AroB-related putative sugar phosphate phospholyase (cyclizing) n=1 Tax=Aeromonas hydrophila TaxID=644 RepID=UPI000F5313CF|nr:AroB-related putative sugar phosphate phospholyase (cyclizing) [Aeromonas hydrophila]RQM71724.1 3-dehydroquinate synthase [Aeromonas hydrophila]